MKRRCVYEGEDVFMKRKMYLWRKDVFMKGKMYLWSEDVFMKGKMYLWRGRCIYEGKMYLWREKKNPGSFEEIENKMLFKNQGNPWNFSSQTYTNSGNFWKKNENVTCESPFLQKIPDFLNLLQLRVSTTQKGNEDVLTADSLQMQYVPRFPSKNPGFLWGMVKGSLRWRFRTQFLRFVVTDFMV